MRYAIVTYYNGRAVVRGIYNTAEERERASALYQEPNFCVVTHDTYVGDIVHNAGQHVVYLLRAFSS